MSLVILLLGDLSHNVVHIVALGIVEDQRQEPHLSLPLQVACVTGCSNVFTCDVVMVPHFLVCLASERVLAEVAVLCKLEAIKLLCCERFHGLQVPMKAQILSAR